MNQIKLVVVGLLGLSVASSAEAQCVRRTPTVVSIVQQAAGKVIPMIERSEQGRITFQPAFGWQLTSIPHVIEVRNNDDLSCGGAVLAVGIDTNDGSGPTARGQTQGVYVPAGASRQITFNEALTKAIQPGSSSSRNAHACRVSINGIRWLEDCSAPHLTQINALMGPPLVAINGDTTIPDHYNSLNQPIVVSSSVQNMALNISALTQESILEITGLLCPIQTWSGGGFSCVSDKSRKEIMRCGAGSQGCSTSIRPSRLGVGRYALTITAVNQADGQGIKHGNQVTRILEIVP